MEELKKLIQQAKDDFSKVSELADLDHVKSKYLGKQGPLTEAMKSLSSLPSKEKPLVGSLINDIHLIYFRIGFKNIFLVFRQKV